MVGVVAHPKTGVVELGDGAQDQVVGVKAHVVGHPFAVGVAHGPEAGVGGGDVAHHRGEIVAVFGGRTVCCHHLELGGLQADTGTGGHFDVIGRGIEGVGVGQHTGTVEVGGVDVDAGTRVGMHRAGSILRTHAPFGFAVRDIAHDVGAGEAAGGVVDLRRRELGVADDAQLEGGAHRQSGTVDGVDILVEVAVQKGGGALGGVVHLVVGTIAGIAIGHPQFVGGSVALHSGGAITVDGVGGHGRGVVAVAPSHHVEHVAFARAVHADVAAAGSGRTGAVGDAGAVRV